MIRHMWRPMSWAVLPASPRAVRPPIEHPHAISRPEIERFGRPSHRPGSAVDLCYCRAASFFTTRQRTFLSDFALPSCRIGNVLLTAARRNAPKSVQRLYGLLRVIGNRYQSGDHLHFSPPHFYWYREMNAAVRERGQSTNLDKPTWRRE